MSMQNINLQVERRAKGVPADVAVDPNPVTLDRGQAVLFNNTYKAPMLLLFKEPDIFGQTEYTIDGQDALRLQVNHTLAAGAYNYHVRVVGDPPPRDIVPCIIIDPD